MQDHAFPASLVTRPVQVLLVLFSVAWLGCTCVWVLVGLGASDVMGARSPGLVLAASGALFTATFAIVCAALAVSLELGLRRPVVGVASTPPLVPMAAWSPPPAPVGSW